MEAFVRHGSSGRREMKIDRADDAH
jgi:hypothetical protein